MAEVGKSKLTRDGRSLLPQSRDAFEIVVLEGRKVPVRLRRSRRARRLVLRVDAEREGIVVTLPLRVPLAEGMAFVRRKADWVLDRLNALPPRVPFVDGALVPFLGREHRVRHRPEVRRGVWREDGCIHVSGRSEHVPRRLRDWLRTEASAEIGDRVRHCAARLGVVPGRITLRDTRSRWGSCGARAGLSFSWRLVMAPEPVLDYVVAHEVAHLVVRNHGPEFWAAVAALGVDIAGARAWLLRQGRELHRFGAVSSRPDDDLG